MKEARGDYRIWAVVAYLLFFVPLLVAEAKKSDFVRFHVRQGLGLFIAFFALRFLTLIALAPLFVVVGWLSLILIPIVNIFLLAVLIIGIINAVNGERKPLPIIGKWAEKHLGI
jgi:uncharacterized membrane protein